MLDRLPVLRGVRGRMERAARLPNGAVAYVDYAHTPDALERLLTALRPHTTGPAARRFRRRWRPGPRQASADGARRPARLADVAIVTDDNPRSEDPATIRAAILAACPGAREIGDRAKAIGAALNDLAAGDVLVVAGKGHEQGQTVGRTVLPFDDATVIRRLAGCRRSHDPMSQPLWTASELMEATGGTLSAPFDASGVSIDTRTLSARRSVHRSGWGWR